jgi:hypothetical protein
MAAKNSCCRESAAVTSASANEIVRQLAPLSPQPPSNAKSPNINLAMAFIAMAA